LPSAFIDGPGAVGDAPSSLDFSPDRRMGLPALELLERGNVRVGVVERDDEAQGDLIVLLVIKKAAAPRVRQRPALGVNHSSRLMFLGRNVPQLFDSKSKHLRTTAFSKAEDFGQSLGQMAARAFGEEGVFRMQLDPRLVVGTVRSVA